MGNIFGSKVSKEDEEFREQALQAHNAYRQKHGAPSMTLDKKLNDHAQQWAEHLASKGVLQHRPREGESYGENLFMGSNPAGVTAQQAVDSWYNEIKDYDFSQPVFGLNTGHFTQVVWKNSSQLGVGLARPKDKPDTLYVVANYAPAGNVQGQFDDNVLRN